MSTPLQKLTNNLKEEIKKLSNKPYISDEQLSANTALANFLDCIRRAAAEVTETDFAVKWERE